MLPDVRPESIAHRQALFRLVRIAKAIMAAEGPDEDLARHLSEMHALVSAVEDARRWVIGQHFDSYRDTWPMLAQACHNALQHIQRLDGTPAARANLLPWTTIVGALLPMVASDWQAMRHATDRKLGGQARG